MFSTFIFILLFGTSTYASDSQDQYPYMGFVLNISDSDELLQIIDLVQDETLTKTSTSMKKLGYRYVFNQGSKTIVPKDEHGITLLNPSDIHNEKYCSGIKSSKLSNPNRKNYCHKIIIRPKRLSKVCQKPLGTYSIGSNIKISKQMSHCNHIYNNIVDRIETKIHLSNKHFTDPGFIRFDSFMKKSLTENEIISQFLLWTITSSPLLIQGDLQTLTQEPNLFHIFTNPNIIQINQRISKDANLYRLGNRIYPRHRILKSGSPSLKQVRWQHHSKKMVRSIWYKYLSPKKAAIVYFNQKDTKNGVWIPEDDETNFDRLSKTTFDLTNIKVIVPQFRKGQLKQKEIYKYTNLENNISYFSKNHMFVGEIQQHQSKIFLIEVVANDSSSEKWN
ncbi:hypothetical protein OAB57_01425 [Bacteriovoracaceae bacterium]|nr:hypothetical protein [Bacteriovoracaceae bacterium]